MNLYSTTVYGYVKIDLRSLMFLELMSKDQEWDSNPTG